MPTNVKSGREARVGEGNGKPSRRGGAGRGAKRVAWHNVPGAEQWDAWMDHLQARTQPIPLAALAGSRNVSPWKWVVPDAYAQLPAPRVLKRVARLVGKGKRVTGEAGEWLEDWLGSLPRRTADELLGLESVVWAHALPRLAALVPRALWCRLWSELHQLVDAAAGLSLHDDPVTHQLLQGELPMALAYVLPEWSGGSALVTAASRSISLAAVELLDGEGLPAACHVGASRSLLACWTRCAAMARSAGRPGFDPEGRAQYEWMVRQSLRLSRPDGTLVLSNGASGDWSPDLMRAALAEGGERADWEAARRLLPGRLPDCRRGKSRKLPEPSVMSEWSEACVMRAKWSRRSPQYTCLFADRHLRSELSAAGRLVWSGDASPELSVNGQPCAIDSDWRQLCWFTDADVDYLELEADFQDGWTIQRQMLLARADDFLFLADAVLGPSPARIDYATNLVLADEIRFDPETGTWEGTLTNQRPLSTVLPLALPEWRASPTRGALRVEGNRLRLTLSDQAQRLYAPLFFDLSARRLRERRTWRPLTVAEHLEIVPRDVAVGYRVQLARSQWLIYRSLTERRNRSVLGQNTSDEFVVARFDLDGCLDELIEIQSG